MLSRPPPRCKSLSILPWLLSGRALLNPSGLTLSAGNSLTALGAFSLQLPQLLDHIQDLLLSLSRRHENVV